MPKAKISAEDFALRVLKKLTKKPQNSVDIAAKFKEFVTAEGTVKPYGAAKVRKALKALAASGQAVHEGQFRTSTYRLP